MVTYWSKLMQIHVAGEFHAAPTKVFEVMNDSTHFFEVRPNATEHEIFEVFATGGHRCRQTFRTKRGTVVEGTSETIEFIPGRLVVDLATTPNGASRVTSRYEPAGARGPGAWV